MYFSIKPVLAFLFVSLVLLSVTLRSEAQKLIIPKELLEKNEKQKDVVKTPEQSVEEQGHVEGPILDVSTVKSSVNQTDNHTKRLLSGYAQNAHGSSEEIHGKSQRRRKSKPKRHKLKRHSKKHRKPKRKNRHHK